MTSIFKFFRKPKKKPLILSKLSYNILVHNKYLSGLRRNTFFSGMFGEYVHLSYIYPINNPTRDGEQLKYKYEN